MHTKQFSLFFSALLGSVASLSACGGDDDDGGPSVPAGVELARSDAPRDLASALSEAERDSLAEGNQAFALALYQELRGEDGNLFLSPFSISVALAMTYAGAQGDTETQMAEAMRFELPEPTLHSAFNAVDLELQGRGEAAKGTEPNEPFRLHIVNQTWGQPDYPFLDSFLETLAVHYGAGMFLIDFAGDPERSRQIINSWVEEQTEDRIENLIPMGVIDGSTRLVLTNAIYFNAAWDSPFDRDDTEDGTFFTPGGEVTLPLMTQNARLRYAEGDGYRAVELPYDENALRFVAVLPAEGRFDEIEQGFDAAFLQTLLGDLGTHMTTVTMPRFEFEAPFMLNDALMSLGMVDAFTGGADFSGITGGPDLYIQAVVHKAFVAVNEEGTEAAAATAVIAGETSAPEPAEIRLDRPFLFFIFDQPTGQILFFGRLTDPS